MWLPVIISACCSSVLPRCWKSPNSAALCVSRAVDKRIESEESGDEEGRKQAVRLVTELSQQSLRDEQNGENSAGTVSASAPPPGVPAAWTQPAAAPCAPCGCVLVIRGNLPRSNLLEISINCSAVVARIKLAAFYGTANIRSWIIFFPYLFTHPCFSLKCLMSKCKPSLFMFFFYGNLETLCGKMLEIFVRSNHEELFMILP